LGLFDQGEMQMRIFVTGGTGQIGRRLIPRLQKRQDEVVLLTRRPEAARQQLGDQLTLVEGDPTQSGPWMERVIDCDAVINLAGENLFNRRWNEAFKRQIQDSRIKATDHVVQALARVPRPTNGELRVLVNGSAIGYYGYHEEEELTEESPPGADFLARSTQAWEQAARAAERPGLRVALVRIGVVLDKEGGALAKLMLPFKLGTGGPVGSGRQWMSWIHHEDLVGLFLLALDRPEVIGPINATAPRPVTNKQFAKALGRALHRPAIVPTPGFALKLILGEVADVVVKGQKVLPKKAVALGYAFRFPDIDAALADAVT
jgi:uncharacterized protein (TIGR01777 family)